MDISVVIVSWNGKDYLKKCLQSISVAPSLRSMEVIVVDNASTDGCGDMVMSEFPKVKLIRSAENLGFAKANNVGIRASTGRYLALVNPDVEVLPGCFDALAEYLDNNPLVGNVGPRVLNTDLTLQSSCRRFPSVWNNLCTATGLASALKGSAWFSGEHMLYFAHDEVRTVDVLVGCFWMLRRRAVEEIGFLDEDFFMYGEDVDFCRRCWNAGWKVVFVPDGRAIHHRGKSSASQPTRSAVAQLQSILLYWSKHHGNLGVLAIRIIFFCHHALRYVVSQVSKVLGRSKNENTANRVRTSTACLQALFHGAIPR